MDMHLGNNEKNISLKGANWYENCLRSILQKCI